MPHGVGLALGGEEGGEGGGTGALKVIVKGRDMDSRGRPAPVSVHPDIAKT